jgi:hypothetical protein
MFTTPLLAALVLVLAFFVFVDVARYIPLVRAIDAPPLRRLFGYLALAIILAVASPIAALAQEAAAAAPTDSGWVAHLWDYVRTPAAIAWMVGLLMAVLPQGESGTAWGMLRTLLDLVAANFGNAKNEPKT